MHDCYHLTTDRDKPLDIDGTMIYFRGFRILKATLKALFEKGLNDASEVVLSGCSGTDGHVSSAHYHLSFIAGGLATYLHADYVQSALGSTVKYHALADAGYFIDAENITGQLHIRELYKYGADSKVEIVHTQ